MRKGRSLALRTPDRQGVQALEPKTLKALVVEADYFALTSRVDANVLFWAPGFAKNGVPEIPEDITHLWVHKQVPDAIRIKLYVQADTRGIVLWDCSIGILRVKLLSFWADPTNRSLISVVQPDEEHSEYSFELPPIIDDTDPAEKRRKARRLRDLRETGRRFAISAAKRSTSTVARESNKVETHALTKVAAKPTLVKSAPIRQGPDDRPVVKNSPALVQALEKLPKIERETFQTYDRLEWDVAATAREMGLAESNTRNLINRCRVRLRSLGVDETWIPSA